MADNKGKGRSALATEGNVTGNENLNQVVNDLKAADLSDPPTISEKTAVIPLDRHIYGLDRNKKPYIVFFAGWYLSKEEYELKEQLLNDPETAEMNEEMQEKLKGMGFKTKVQPAQLTGGEVLDLGNKEEDE